MAFIPSPGVAQGVLVGTWANLIQLRTIFHVQRRGELLGSAWSVADLTNAALRLSEAFQNFTDNLSNVALYNRIDMRDLIAVDGTVYSFPAALAGTDAAVSTGPYEGPVINWKTGKAGRTNGRTYLPGTSEATVDNIGLLTPDRQGAWKSRADAFLADINAPTDATHLGPPLDLVIQSQKPTTSLPITRPANAVKSTSVRAEIGIQRRRRPSEVTSPAGSSTHQRPCPGSPSRLGLVVRPPH